MAVALGLAAFVVVSRPVGVGARAGAERGTSTLVRSVPVGSDATAMAVSPSGKVAYVVHMNSGALTVVNLVTRQTAAVTVGSNLTDVVLSANGRYAYVTSNGSNSNFHVVATATDRVVHTVDVSGSSSLVALSANGQEAYVALDDALAIVDLRTLRVVAKIPTGLVLGAAIDAVSPNGKTVYLASDHGLLGHVSLPSKLVVVNVPRRSVTATRSEGNGGDPCGLAVTPDGRELYESFCGFYVGTPRSQMGMKVLDARTGTTERRVSRIARALAIGPNGKDLIAASDSGTSLSILRTSNLGQVTSIPLEAGRYGANVQQLSVTANGRDVDALLELWGSGEEIEVVRLPSVTRR